MSILHHGVAALELWRQWFDWDGDPWVEDNRANVTCFFCLEDKPNHTSNCTYERARNLLIVSATELGEDLE